MNQTFKKFTPKEKKELITHSKFGVKLTAKPYPTKYDYEVSFVLKTASEVSSYAALFID